MAKRHKHYSGKGKGNKQAGGGGNSKTKKSKKANGKGKSRYGRDPYINSTEKSHEDAWINSSMPGMGDAELEMGLDRPHGDIYRGRAFISPETIEDYYFGKRTLDKHSMKAGGLRPGHHSTGNSNNTSTTSLSSYHSNNKNSKKMMVFVKSKEVYDPSHDMIEKLIAKNKQKHEAESNDVGTDKLYTEENDSDTSEIVTDSAFEETNSIEIPVEDTLAPKSPSPIDNIEVDIVVEKESSEPNPSTVESSSSEEYISDKDLFFIDESGYENETMPTVRSIHVEEPDIKPVVATNLEFNPTIAIGKVELNLKENQNKDIVVDPGYRSHPFSGYISNVMGKLNNNSGSDSDNESEFDIEYEDSDGGEFEYTDKDLVNTLSDEDNFKTDITESIESLNIEEENEDEENDENEDENKEPEFGFLEEDFLVNTSELSVTNIRLGLNENSYYVQSYKFFGDYDSRWVEHELLADHIVNDLGLPEHRLNSYLRYVKDSLIPKEEPPEPTFSDIQFSDTSSDDEVEQMYGDERVTNDMLEGLDDLVSYSLKYNDSRNIEYETKTIPTIGKGKKKKLLIDESLQLDGETITTLQQNYGKRLRDKAKKRRTKEDFISEENKKSDDLLKKYPYGLHVLNIRDEMELFFERNKDSVSFPPLDPHGNKTVAKFASHYNMKTKKSGRGKHQHIIVQKVKKTKWSTPNYNLINQLVKQRPVFMRIDVERTNDQVTRSRITRERVTEKAKFHVKEGELVGEDAPEIGHDNIGRRLLEKLGWSMGEGLGAHGNKGISEPVLAVVKKNKTGLGHHKHEQEDEEAEEGADGPKRHRGQRRHAGRHYRRSHR